MKATDLMIGDWVQDTGPVLIDAISNEDICTYRNEYGYVTANPSNLKPIPLTAEILEKNGFVYNDIPFVDGWEQYGLTLYKGCDGFRINCGRNIYLILDYVHELQHTLRLCGIDKEITL